MCVFIILIFNLLLIFFENVHLELFKENIYIFLESEEDEVATTRQRWHKKMRITI